MRRIWLVWLIAGTLLASSCGGGEPKLYVSPDTAVYNYPPADGLLTHEGLRPVAAPEQIDLASADGPAEVVLTRRIADTDAWIELQSAHDDGLKGWVEINKRGFYPVRRGSCEDDAECPALRPPDEELAALPAVPVVELLPEGRSYPYVLLSSVGPFYSFPGAQGIDPPVIESVPDPTFVEAAHRLAEDSNWMGVQLADGRSLWKNSGSDLARITGALDLREARSEDLQIVVWTRPAPGQDITDGLNDLALDEGSLPTISFAEVLPPELRGSGLPDLVIQEIRVSAVYEGGPCELPVALTNRGSGVAVLYGPLALWHYDVRPGETLVAINDIEIDNGPWVIPPGASAETIVPISAVLTTGDDIVVDPYNRTIESDETNNRQQPGSTAGVFECVSQ